MNKSKIIYLLGFMCIIAGNMTIATSTEVYEGTIAGKEILTPKPGLNPKITGAQIFGVRPGKPIRFCVSATGMKPMNFAATGLPAGVSIDRVSGWITGRAPKTKTNFMVTLTASNAKGKSSRKMIMSVGDTICLTPPMGWNSWYAHSEAVSDASIRSMATAINEKGLSDHGWSYVNIDDCWMGERDPQTKAIQANAKFGNMKNLADFVNSKGLKLGIYSTLWMSTYAGYMGGTAPNDEADYSEFYLPEKERKNRAQIFGRCPNGIKKGLCTIGETWLVDKDAQQFADWGIDYVKYDWKEWQLVKKNKGGYGVDGSKAKIKTEANTKRFYDDFRALDRDIVISLSPCHTLEEDKFVTKYCNLWRLTNDIHAKWDRIIAPFSMEHRLKLTRPGVYGDLDMLQFGPLGKPNRANTVFKPSPLKPAEQYFQMTLWCLLTQPLLLSCNIPKMDEFDLNLATNDEVLSVNQDPLVKQGYRIHSEKDSFEIWAKDLADGSKAVGLFNLANKDQNITVTAKQLGLKGNIRDLWRQKDIEILKDSFTAKVSPHGVVFVKITPIPTNH